MNPKEIDRVFPSPNAPRPVWEDDEGPVGASPDLARPPAPTYEEGETDDWLEAARAHFVPDE